MSDLFKKHRPTLTDEEDRRLWQRVRVPVAQSPVRASWWRSLTAMPAVRYGVPALAVVLVAVVWVVDRAPRAPVRDTIGTQSVPEVAPSPGRQDAADKAVPGLESRATRSIDAPAPAPVNEQMAGRRSAVATTEREGAVDEKNVGKKEAASGALLDQPREEAQSKDQARMASPAPSPVPPPAVVQNQKVGGESDRGFARAPVKSGATAPANEAPAAGAAAPSSELPQQVLGKTMALYRESRPDGSTEAIVTSVLDPARNGALLGAAAGPFADSPSRLVAVVAGGPVRLRAAETTRRELVPEIEAGRVTVHRITGDGRVVATLDATGGALQLDAPATSYARAEPRLQLALLAIEYAQALEARESTPRARLEALRDAARRVEARGGPGVAQGAARLIGMIEGSLTGWPSR